MTLTDDEKVLIARRAGGEYAAIPQIRKLVANHHKNRNPDDEVYLSFARLSVRKSWDWDDYEEKAQAVLAFIPHPWSPDAAPKEPKKEPDRRKGVAGLLNLLDDQENSGRK